MDLWRDNQRSRRLGANMRYYRGRTTNQFDDMVTRMGSSDPMTIDQYDWEEDTNDPQERKMIHKPTKESQEDCQTDEVRFDSYHRQDQRSNIDSFSGNSNSNFETIMDNNNLFDESTQVYMNDDKDNDAEMFINKARSYNDDEDHNSDEFLSCDEDMDYDDENISNKSTELKDDVESQGNSIISNANSEVQGTDYLSGHSKSSKLVTSEEMEFITAFNNKYKTKDKRGTQDKCESLNNNDDQQSEQDRESTPNSYQRHDEADPDLDKNHSNSKVDTKNESANEDRGLTLNSDQRHGEADKDHAKNPSNSKLDTKNNSANEDRGSAPNSYKRPGETDKDYEKNPSNSKVDTKNKSANEDRESAPNSYQRHGGADKDHAENSSNSKNNSGLSNNDPHSYKSKGAIPKQSLRYVKNTQYDDRADNYYDRKAFNVGFDHYDNSSDNDSYYHGETNFVYDDGTYNKRGNCGNRGSYQGGNQRNYRGRNRGNYHRENRGYYHGGNQGNFHGGNRGNYNEETRGNYSRRNRGARGGGNYNNKGCNSHHGSQNFDIRPLFSEYPSQEQRNINDREYYSPRDHNDKRDSHHNSEKNVKKRNHSEQSEQSDDNWSHPNYNQIMCELVETLLKLDDSSFSLLKLFEEHNLNPILVRKTVEKYPKILKIKDEAVHLQTQINICKYHNSREGCKNRNKCSDIHICKDFLIKICKYGKDCDYGHHVESKHNLKILEHLEMQPSMTQRILKFIMKNLYIEKESEIKTIEVCEYHNLDGCRNRENCSKLHICLKYLAEICDYDDKCMFKHDFSFCQKIIDTFKIAGESKKDTILRIKNLRNVQNQIKKCKSSSIVLSKDLRSSPERQLSDKSCWNHEMNGNVKIPEICFHAYNAKCRYESSGCKRLHSTEKFQWQFIEKSQGWINIPSIYSKLLEKGYSALSDHVTIKFVAKEIPQQMRPILSLFKGTHVKADLKSMIISAPNQQTFQLRRLVMESNNVSNMGYHEWYFLDDSKKWVKYGEANAKGKSSKITSDDIENSYKNDPNGIYSFQFCKRQYIIDFKGMMQTNLDTNGTKKVSRRPKHVMDTQYASSFDSTKYNSNWDPMNYEADPVKLFKLDPSSSEYQQIKSFVESHNIRFKILDIQRIQNPSCVKTFKNNLERMKVLLKRNIVPRRLFHGTSSGVVQNICNENFDWKLNSTANGVVHGKGTYFSPDPNVAHSYARGAIFIAQVIFEDKILGNSSMDLPPINPATGYHYDSTVNDLSKPTIIVKYDKQQYYPEYLLTIQ